MSVEDIRIVYGDGELEGELEGEVEADGEDSWVIVSW